MANKRSPQPWDRQVGETSRAFAAFCAYLLLDPKKRSIAKALESSGKSRVKLQQWELWSTKYKWASRARSYDVTQTQQLREASEVRRTEMVERHAALARATLGQVVTSLNSLNANPRILTPWEIGRLLDVCTKVERLSVGLPTETTEVCASVQAEAPDYSKMTDEELAESARVSITKTFSELGFQQWKIDLFLELLVNADRNRVDLVTSALRGDQYAVQKLFTP